MKKIVSLALASAMVLGLLAGCGGKTEPAVESQAPVVESKAPETQTPADGPFNLNVNVASEPQTIDPALNSAVDGAIMTGHMFEGLYKWADSGNLVDGVTDCDLAELVPGQAESYEKTEGENGEVIYTFKLRSDAKWSDGKAVTADDFVYAWKRLATPETAADYCYMIDMVKGYAEVEGGADPDTLAVEAPDDSTFVVTLTYDCPYFLEVCAFPAAFPVREDVVSADPDGWTHNVSTYLTNGAYKLAQWDHNSQIVMAKSENYYDYDKLGPDTITFKLMDDANAMLTGFNSGELDFIEDMPVDELPSLISSGDLRIVPYVGTYYVCYNTEKAPFDDWRVRKAFTLAIDAQYIVENVTQTGQLPASGFVPSGVAGIGPDFRAEGGDYWTPATDDDQYAKNVAEAQQLMADAGYPEGKGFPTVTYLYNTNDNHKKIGEALQQQWQTALGVEVKLENQEWAAFLETRKNGEYQIARNGWIADYNDPISFLDMWLTGGGNNDAQYSNKDYDAAIARAKSTADPTERMTAMHEAEDIIMGQDWALGPIYFYTQKYMLNSDVKGMYYTPLGYFFFDRCTR